MVSKSEKTLSSKAIVYARVSSKEQDKEGFSIPAQLKLLTEYATNNHFSIVREFIDVETAKQSGRNGFVDMVRYFKEQLKKISNEPCRLLLVEKTDRLYRNFKDYVTLDELDIEIHLVKENAVISKYSRSNEKFMHGIKVLMAKNYIDNLSEETKKGMLEKAEQGTYPSAAPLGYINVECDSKRFIQPDPSLAHFIKLLFEWYATGNYSLSEISQKIGEEGLEYRKSGAKIPKSAVHKILKNPIYYGDFYWDKRLFQGTHEPLITKELYDRVQVVMVEKGKRRTRQQKHHWAFQGMLICGHCGCALTAEIKKGRYVYYHCTGNRGKCPEKYVREEEVARQFGEALQMIRMDEKVISWVVSALKDSHKDEKEYHDRIISSLQRQYEKLQSRIDTMYIDKLDGEITKDFYEQKSNAWRLEQENILRKIEKHQNANQAYLDDGIKLLELSQNAVTLYNNQEMPEKRRLLNFVCSNSIWKHGRLYPEYRKPFDMIAEMNIAYNQKKAVFTKENDLFDFWLPSTDSNRGPGG